MSRSSAWRRCISDIVSWRQDQALSSTLYIVRTVGPTGFYLKEENKEKIIKTFLGDPHRCSCSDFQKDGDLCRHICWLLLKKFRISRQNPVSWQVGLVAREINEILQGLISPTSTKTPCVKTATSSVTDSRPVIEQRVITSGDVCPICQDGLLEKKLPVTFCKYGCGNSTHIKCMKVWADHQKSQGDKTILCPFCREDFGPIDLLKQEDLNARNQGGRTIAASLNRHFGTTCRGCYMNDITGKCYRCVACLDFHLCQGCFNTPIHREHTFQFRQKRTERWRPAVRPTGWLLPEAVSNDLMHRDITENDYDLLVQLDRQRDGELSNIPLDVVEALPQEKIRQSSLMLAPGVQCRMCLQAYHIDQIVRCLPCRHKFHRRCVDPYLIHSQPSCPVCGLLVWNEHMHLPNNDVSRNVATKPPKAPRQSQVTSDKPLSLELPGVGIASLANRCNNARKSDPPPVPSSSTSTSHESDLNLTSDLCQATSNSRSRGLRVNTDHTSLPKFTLPRRHGQVMLRAASTRSLPQRSRVNLQTSPVPPLVGVNIASLCRPNDSTCSDKRVLSADSCQPLRHRRRRRSTLAECTEVTANVRDDLFLGNKPHATGSVSGDRQTNKVNHTRRRLAHVVHHDSCDPKLQRCSSINDLVLDGVYIGP